MDKQQKEAGCNQRFVRNTVKQGDVVLVNFGRGSKESRSLSGNKPVYVLSRQMKDEYGSAVLVIPLFRQESRDGVRKDVEITPAVCKGLRYSEYAQPMNLKKIRRNQIVRRIGHVQDETVHDNLLSSMWNQIDKSGEGLR